MLTFWDGTAVPENLTVLSTSVYVDFGMANLLCHAQNLPCCA